MDNTSLTALTRELLESAGQATSGRAARTVYGGHEHRLRQTVIALLADRTLDDHENPGEATLYVLHGRVQLVAGSETWSGAAGHLMAVPPSRHSLLAQEDSVVLLTAALTSGDG